MAAVHVTNEQQLEGRGFYLEKAEHYGREMLAGGYERKTLQKKKKNSAVDLYFYYGLILLACS